MRAYLALYVAVFILSALIAYAVLSYSYAPVPMRTATVTTAITHIVTETRTYAVTNTLYTYPTTTTPKILEVPKARSIAKPTTTEASSITRRMISETTVPVAVERVTAESHSETDTGMRTRPGIGVRKLSEKGIVSAYSASRGVVRLLNVSIKFVTVSSNRSYVVIGLLLSASMPSKVLVASIYVEPLPLPFGWNGSSWVIGFDEKHCLRRLSALPSYSYRVEPRVVELEPGKAKSLHIELLFHGPIYGKYILVARLSTGDTLELRFASPDYGDPTTPPPRGLVELAKACGYSVGG